MNSYSGSRAVMVTSGSARSTGRAAREVVPRARRRRDEYRPQPPRTATEKRRAGPLLVASERPECDARMPPKHPESRPEAPGSPGARIPITLQVSELFLSLQGEGPSAGTPAHFLRLQGCDVGCTWCDSKYTWDPAGG